MKRREFIKYAAAVVLGGGLCPPTTLASIPTALQPYGSDRRRALLAPLRQMTDDRTAPRIAVQAVGRAQASAGIEMQVSSRSRPADIDLSALGRAGVGGHAEISAKSPSPIETAVSGGNLDVREYLRKMHTFNRPHRDDIVLRAAEMPLLRNCVRRINRIYRRVGHSNFYLLDFDQGLKIARQHGDVGPFRKNELEFIERLFYRDAGRYGFYGEKPLKNLTHRFKRRAVVKLPGTGNYLFKGPAVAVYKQIKKDVGPKVILTSGVRGILKQLKLFLDKTVNSRGNLSLASRSLAPPGYSFHGVSDFDVGQIGFGIDNFSDRFAETAVFKRLAKLNYVRLRYTHGNMMGVRFEPWHIRVDRAT